MGFSTLLIWSVGWSLTLTCVDFSNPFRSTNGYQIASFDVIRESCNLERLVSSHFEERFDSEEEWTNRLLFDLHSLPAPSVVSTRVFDASVVAVDLKTTIQT